MKKTLIQVRNLAIGYKGRQLFTDISFDICEGDVILLCGANGSGKTTLLKALADVVSDVETAMIPTRIPKVKGFTLNEFIRLTCFDTPEAKPDDALGKLSLSHLSNRDISTLSDGEFQKGTIAAAIAKGAEVLLMDEPTAFLDAENRKNVLTALKMLWSIDSPSCLKTPVFLFVHLSLVIPNTITLAAISIYDCSPVIW